MSDALSWEDDVFAALQANALYTAKVADRTYPSLAPTGVTDGYVVWQEISTEGESTLAGAATVLHPLVQFTAWSSNRNWARDVRKIIKDTFDGKTVAGDFRVSATFSNQLFSFEPDSRLYGALLELRFHLDNQ